MSPTIHHPPKSSSIFMADMAAVAARLGGTALISRLQTLFAGGCPPASRCHCRMAAANTGFPAANSGSHRSSRRQMPQNRATLACSRRQLRRILSS